MWLCQGLHVAWLLAGAPPGGWRPVLANFAYLPIFGLGATLTFQAARHAGTRAAVTWRWLGYGLVFWALAQAGYLVWDTVLHLPTFPTPADAVWLLSMAFFALGLFRLRRERSGWMSALSFLVDAALVTLIVCDLLWSTSVRGVLGSYPGQPLALGVALAYPAIDLLLCALLVVLALWQPRDLARRDLALLAAGLCAFMGADVLYAYQQGQELYRPGTLMDAGWSLGASLMGWAAYGHYGHHRAGVLRSRAAPKPRSPLRRWAPLLPHYGVLAAFLAYLIPHTRRSDLDRVEGALLLVIVGLFVLRQFLILTHNQRLQLGLAHRAEHDPLTGVRNRADLEARLQRTIDGAGRGVAVLFIDLDRMKHVNDTFGHPVGDQVLREVAARLTSLRGPADLLARYGGDEFVLVLAQVTDPAEVAATAGRTVGLIAQPVQVGAETVTLTGSVGVALVPEDARNAAQAIERADAAMYRAKQGDRNTWRFFNDGLNEVLAPQVQLEVLLRGALERREFSVHVQPLITLGTGTVEGFEALLRWHSPVLGPVSPATFIPVAEAREMMGGLGRWVLREALRQAGSWRAGPWPHAHVSVNVSATQFGAADFVADVRSALADAGLPPAALVLELTESAVLAEVEQAREKLRELRALGVRVALDDFGMGYSSLGHLRHLPVDVIKIDKVFVREMGEDNAAFVRAIVALGQSLHLRVVAEGIEDRATAEHLARLGCDVGQGYLYAPPLPLADVASRLELSCPGALPVGPPASRQGPTPR